MLEPSYRERDIKLRKLRELLRQGIWRPAEPTKLQWQFDKLARRFGIDTAAREDQTKILLETAEKAKPNDYCGSHPRPEAAYEPAISDEDLWEFKCRPAYAGAAVVYFKFCLRGVDKGSTVYIVSIHEDNPKPAR